MDFAKEFKKAAEVSEEEAAEMLVQAVKTDQAIEEILLGRKLPLKMSFENAVTRNLGEIASVQIVDKQISVANGHKGNEKTQKAVKRAYEKLEQEEQQHQMSALCPV